MTEEPLTGPLLRPPLPTYPPHIQVCRVTAATVGGPTGSSSPTPVGRNPYVSFTEQVDPTTLLLKDREPCLVLDANRAGLAPGYYVCRLVGNYTGLPLYATQGGSSSSSSSTVSTASFVVPAPGRALTGSSSSSPASTVVITVTDTSQLIVGDTVEVTDGTTVVFGTVVNVLNSTQFTFAATAIIAGAVGSVVAAGAILLFCCPIYPGIAVRGGTPGNQLYIDPLGNLGQRPPQSGLLGQVMTIQPLGGTANVRPDSTPMPWLVNGMEVLIDDGGNAVYGFVGNVTPTSFDLTTSMILSGGPGGTIGIGAAITPVVSPSRLPTTASFTVPALGSVVAVSTPTTDPYSAVNVADLVEIFDGTTRVQGRVTSQSSNSFQFTPTAVPAGVTGSTMKARATIRPVPSGINPMLGLPSHNPGDPNGFPYFPTMPGRPQGTPLFRPTGYVPVQPNTSDPGLWGFMSSGGVDQWVGLTSGWRSGTLPSAGLLNLNNSTGDYVPVSGTTSINSLGVMPAGTRKLLEFQGVLTLVNSASLILPGSANITTAVGDIALAISEGLGTWRIALFGRADGTAVVSSGGGGTFAALSATQTINSASFVDVTGLGFAVAANEVWEFEVELALNVNSGSGALAFQFTGPATPTAVLFTFLGQNSSATLSGEALIALSTSTGATGGYGGAYGAAGTYGMVRIRGYIKNASSAGTLQLQAKQTGVLLSNVIQVGSFLKAAKH